MTGKLALLILPFATFAITFFAGAADLRATMIQIRDEDRGRRR